MKYFDAHMHVNFAAFNEDREEVIARTLKAGVGMNVVGTQFDTSRAASDIARAHDGVWATIGLHPIHTTRSFHDSNELGAGNKEFTSRGEAFDMDAYRELGRNPKVIAVGECGLDYYRNDPSAQKAQKDAFINQIVLANELGKPLMLHIRASRGSMDAYDDALALVKHYARVRGNVHFFAGSWEVARRWLAIGFTLSFTGVLTFTHDYDEVVQNTPLDMILSETDAPYVTPAPYRGTRNEPLYVAEVVRAIARLKGADEASVAAQIMANVRRVFALS